MCTVGGKIGELSAFKALIDWDHTYMVTLFDQHVVLFVAGGGHNRQGGLEESDHGCS